MNWTVQLEILGTVALAMMLGGLIGAEREHADKPAGLRTLMLVAGAAALLVALGDVLVARYANPDFLAKEDLSGPQEWLRSDPIRIVEAIVTGVSFLGAGTIIRGNGGSHVQGLTTAASILFSAAVGIAVALHQFVLAVGATILTLLVLVGLGLLERKVLDGN